MIELTLVVRVTGKQLVKLAKLLAVLLLLV